MKECKLKRCISLEKKETWFRAAFSYSASFHVCGSVLVDWDLYPVETSFKAVGVSVWGPRMSKSFCHQIRHLIGGGDLFIDGNSLLIFTWWHCSRWKEASLTLFM